MSKKQQGKKEMLRIIPNEELSKYTSQIKKPSEAFNLFLQHYAIDGIWIRSRGEEDISVWDKLKGDELDIAKQIILDGLKMVPDISYMRAVSIFKDERAIPILRNIIETYYSEKYIGEKLIAAKVLYDWVGYEDYISMLENACKNQDNYMVYNYLKWRISIFTSGLDEKDKARIMKALEEH